MNLLSRARWRLRHAYWRLSAALERRANPFRLSRRARAALRRYPPFTPGTTMFAGKPFSFSHAPSFVHSVDEIFGERTYRFVARSARPFIVDCGANIGLSVLYFKHAYPDAMIVAFEPDPEIHAMLRQNIVSVWGYSDVVLHQKAVWKEDAQLTFFREGALAGSVVGDYAGANNRVVVDAVDITPILAERVIDFLKIDIEGAENELLPAIAPMLGSVRALAMEYHSLSADRQRLGEILSLLTDHGFRYYVASVRGGPGRPPSLAASKRLFDMQVSIFAERPESL